MGSGRWNADDFKTYSNSKGYDTKTRDEIFASSLAPELNPKGVVRESRDSDLNPMSTPIIIGLDVTGSMGSLAEVIARTGLNTLCTSIYDRKPVTDPHILCAAIGDVESDSAPFQVTQFEADIKISEQLEKFWLEARGGGNMYESYSIAWLFAAMQTKIDSFEKRGKKGYLFTVGDEYPTPRLPSDKVSRFLGIDMERDLSSEDLLTMASRQWEIFHVVILEGSHARSYPDETRKRWTDLLGQRAIMLEDHRKLAEVIVSTIQIHEGADHAAVASSWDGSTALVVRAATKNLVAGSKSAAGVVSL